MSGGADPGCIFQNGGGCRTLLAEKITKVNSGCKMAGRRQFLAPVKAHPPFWAPCHTTAATAMVPDKRKRGPNDGIMI